MTTDSTIWPTSATPAEIDTFLSANWYEQAKLHARLDSLDQTIERYGNDTFSVYKRYADDAEVEKAKAILALRALQADAAPYEAEYNVRRWNRYFLVQNTNGHVHRGMHCSTCFSTTVYHWIVDLADCDEEAMVAQYGEWACTVCFPNAPTYKGFGDGTSAVARYDADVKAQRAAEKDARAAAKAAKTLEPELQFKDWTWRVTTVAAAKQVVRDCAANLAGYGYDHQRSEAPRILADARRALLAKGLTEDELDALEAKAVKTASKRGW